MRKWIVLCAIINPSNALAATVDVRERAAFYDVHGNTAEELTIQMSQRGPSNAFGRRAWAFTEWELHSEYVLMPGEDGCRLAEPSVSLDIVTTLPRWKTTNRSQWKLRTRWKKSMASIIDHENTHKQHALLAARRTAAALAALPPQSECRIAEQSAREIHKREVASARKLSREFDRETNFGATEGVGLGP